MPSGLAKPGGDLGDLLARAGADRGDQPGLVEDPPPQVRAELFDLGLGCAGQLRGLPERLVERKLLDDGQHGAHGVEDPAAGDAVDGAAWRQDDRRHTDQPARLMHRHRGPRPVHPRLVAGAGHHATPAQPADQHGPVSQGGPGELLDGREERVHVEVQHPAGIHNHRCYCATVLGHGHGTASDQALAFAAKVQPARRPLEKWLGSCTFAVSYLPAA